MTIAEKIDALEKELAELKEQIEADVVADYRSVGDGRVYVVTNDNTVSAWVILRDVSNTNYFYYHDDRYAKMAKEMKELNDKLLAFKWCYDREYTPDWDDSSTCKYCVAYDNYSGQYTILSWYGEKYPTVYFSTREVAQKCCDWLNGMMGYE